MSLMEEVHVLKNWDSKSNCTEVCAHFLQTVVFS